jgi:hypothetical protein
MLQFTKPIYSHHFPAVLQRITGGFRYGMFSKTLEDKLRQVIHHEGLRRAGLPWPPDDTCNKGVQYWSTDKKQQDRNRRIYHGLRRGSLQIINKLIGLTLQESADSLALKLARQFAFRYREAMYRAAATSQRAGQLAQAFPVLALSIYSKDITIPFTNMMLKGLEERMADTEWSAKYGEYQARINDAAALVERGARLREIAELMGVPMALRHVKPGAAHLASEYHNPELIVSMPDSLSRMRTWLRVVRHAALTAGSEFGQWAAKNALEIPGSENEVLSFVHDVSDWVRASRARNELVMRPFSPTMSLRTVKALSAEWHEAVASHLNESKEAFPEPWYPAATLNGVDIVPIDNSVDLYREGAAMRHCIGTYADEVKAGIYCIYSVRREGERIATAAVRIAAGQGQLSQIRGPCNAQVERGISATVERWVRSQSRLKKPKREDHHPVPETEMQSTKPPTSL